MPPVDPKLFAVLVGVDGYERSDGAVCPPDLAGSVREVEAWEAVLHTAGADPANVRWCVSPRGRPRANATAVRIREAFGWLMERLASPGARGVVVLAGHLEEGHTFLASDAPLDPANRIDLDAELLAPAGALDTDFDLVVVVAPPSMAVLAEDRRITLASARLGKDAVPAAAAM